MQINRNKASQYQAVNSSAVKRSKFFLSGYWNNEVPFVYYGKSPLLLLISPSFWECLPKDQEVSDSTKK